MYQKGELDPAVAMQLLGSAVQTPESLPGGTKRSLDSQAGGSRESGKDGSPEGCLESLDQVLQQAKRAKMDPL